ncbi:MAG: hypothetical protein MZV63_51075 [Marinilabiliales bacterium]|nr:hypothetical protein [Marinilabiliales bacterium]
MTISTYIVKTAGLGIMWVWVQIFDDGIPLAPEYLSDVLLFPMYYSNTFKPYGYKEEAIRKILGGNDGILFRVFKKAEGNDAALGRLYP